MARFCPLFSSSSGNCTYIGGAGGAVLIDAGRSARQIVLALEDMGTDISQIQAVFVTHEHSDHVKGLRVLASKYNLKVYTSKGTLDALEQMNILNNKFLAEIIPEDGIEIAGMEIHSFRTSHDCNESVGYVIHMADDRKIAIATDLGYMSDEVMDAVSGCDLVMIESNHDVRMLENGPYPYYLKRRILSNKGHLSNDSCANVLPELVKSGTTRFVLAHLSQHNNYPELAYQTSMSALSAAGAKESEDFVLSVAKTESPEKVTVF